MGDNVNLAVGQGDLQADPLQMAVAYAAIANGGDVVRPHVGLEVQDPNGSVVQEIDPAPQRHLDINPQYRSAILTGIHKAAQSPGGTSYPVFGELPDPDGRQDRYGAAHRARPDQSWYVVLAPYPNPQIVVAATIEQGGFGVQAAAPVGAADPRRLLRRASGTRPRRPAARSAEAAPISSTSAPAAVGEPLLMVSDAYPSAVRRRRAPGERRASAPASLGLDPLLLLAALGADRLQPLHAGRGHRPATSPTAPTSTSSARRSTR